MAYPDIATKEGLAKELAGYATVAETLEDLIRYVDAVVTAVNDTDLLDKLPADEEAKDKHNAACVLLSDLGRRLRAYQQFDDEREGTDLSIALHVLAKDVGSGRFAHRRVLEEV